MLIDLYDDEGNILAASVPLSDCYPGDHGSLAFAAVALTLDAVHVEGGGAAPIHVLRPAGA